MLLNDSAIRNAKPGPKPRKMADGGGLYLEVSPAGGKWWRLKYRFADKEKRLSLGVYPETSLRLARDRREAARELLAQGIDPGVVRKEDKARAAVAAENSFESVARRWHESWKTTRTEKHAAQVLRRLELDVFPAIGGTPIDKIRAPMLLQVAHKVDSRGAGDLARRDFQICGQILRYAVGHGLIEFNPAASVHPGDALKPRVKKHRARIEPRELPALLRALDGYEGNLRTRIALQLMALTFVRTIELIAARWDEFDLVAGQWRIPAERMKMRTPHIVPLSRQALALLGQLKETGTGRVLLFPGERDHERPMSNNTILFALYRLGYHGRMTGHGFRGVASTILHELGYRHDHIELQLAHQERDQVAAAYNHATYIRERGKMMQDWADHLDRLRAGGEVLAFAQAQAQAA
jgi:integrase